MNLMNENYWLYPIVFALLMTIHNTEEGLWFPDWSKNAGKYYKPVDGKEFRFAVFIMTVIAYMVSFLVVIYGFETFIGKVLAGFMGAMLLNAIFPHLSMTIAMRRYVPGVITGVFLNIPILSLMILELIRANVIGLFELILYTFIMSVILLLIIIPLFNLARLLLKG